MSQPYAGASKSIVVLDNEPKTPPAVEPPRKAFSIPGLAGRYHWRPLQPQHVEAFGLHHLPAANVTTLPVELTATNKNALVKLVQVSLCPYGTFTLAKPGPEGEADLRLLPAAVLADLAGQVISLNNLLPAAAAADQGPPPRSAAPAAADKPKPKKAKDGSAKQKRDTKPDGDP